MSRKKRHIVFEHDDGGRAAAGLKGKTGDCVVRAAAIITGRPYLEMCAMYADVLAEDARRGKFDRETYALMEQLGLQWVACRNTHVRASELPSGRIVVRLSHHVAAVINGVLHDNHDSSREGTRMVYGYWRMPETK